MNQYRINTKLLPKLKQPSYQYRNPLYYQLASSFATEKIIKETPKTPEIKKKSIWDPLIEKYGEHTTHAIGNVNRWKFVPMAVSTHLCLGACYAWSIFNEPLSREIGVVAAAASDWALSSCVGTFTTIIISQGLSMAFFGKWVQKVGPRIAGVTGSLLYGSGMILGSIGVMTHQLPLLYLGYGAIAGCGMGLAYLPPLATLINWFPDKRGLASGMAICGFGGGAVGIVQLKKYLLEKFYQSPTYIGTMDEIITKRDNSGKLLSEYNNNFVETINLTSNEISLLPNYISNELSEGLYIVGTGNTGVASTMGVLGCGYLAICLTSSMLIKTPPIGYGNVAKQENKNIKYVDVDNVMKTPQFWLIWTTFLSTATAGMGLLSCAKDVLVTCFAQSPMAISMGLGAFAAGYVQLLAIGNLSGRFGWATVSDYIGRKNLFTMMTSVGGPIYFILPFIVSNAIGSTSVVPIVMFYGTTMVFISFFGAGYSTMPAYETDLFGVKHVSAIHGRIMTASALSGITGPMIFSKFHDIEEKKAINNLCNLVDNNKFIDIFGVNKDKIDQLINTKQINITKLLEICPDGTIDPTPYLYDPAFKTMGVCLGIGCLANLLVKPVNEKYFTND